MELSKSTNFNSPNTNSTKALEEQLLMFYASNNGRTQKFSKEQLEQIQLGIEQGLDVTAYVKLEFSPCQMEQIRVGLEHGLDVSIYAKPEFDFNYNHKFNSDQMRWIRIGLENNIDTSIYAKPEFNSDQMRWILYGLRENLNVSVYAKPEFNADQMQGMRRILVELRELLGEEFTIELKRSDQNK